MPSKSDLSKAEALVLDLISDDMVAMRNGTKAPGEVAAAQLELAGKAETEAGKYLLLKSAFKVYARGGDYDAAADVIERMRQEIADFPPEEVVGLVNGEMSRVPKDKAPIQTRRDRPASAGRRPERLVRAGKRLEQSMVQESPVQKGRSLSFPDDPVGHRPRPRQRARRQIAETLGSIAPAVRN